jgi:hypothetical protein
MRSVKVLARHEAVAGVFVIDRVRHKDRGPYVCGLFLGGRDCEHLMPRYAKFETAERACRLIGDWID